MAPTCYSSIEYSTETRRKGLLSFMIPLAYLTFGMLLGYMIATVRQETGAAQFKWLIPAWRRFQHESHTSQLYDASQAEKFVNLRQRIDEEINSQINTVETTAGEPEYDPFRFSLELLDRINTEFDRFFQDLAASIPAEAKLLHPAAFSVDETDGEIRIKCKAPGLNPEKMSIDLEGQQLMISATIIQESDTTQMQSQFSRIFIVPEGVKAKDISATADGDQVTIVVKKPTTALDERQPILIQANE